MRSIIPQEDNPILRNKAQPIDLAEISSTQIKTLIRDMKKLLAKERHGVAIAAQQVGEPLQLFIVSGRALSARDTDDEDEAKDEVEELPDQIYINPVILKMSHAKKEKHEGCLSIRGKWGMVPRAKKATIQAYDEHGQKFTRGASGFLAHVFQHEMDHINGILYTDKAAKLFDDKLEGDKKSNKTNDKDHDE
jgi:peptide deformylase